MNLRKSKYTPPSRFNRIASGFLFASLLSIGFVQAYMFMVSGMLHANVEWFRFAWRNGKVDSRKWADSIPTTFRNPNLSLIRRLYAVFLTSLMTIGVWALMASLAIPGILYFCIKRGFKYGMENGLSSGYKKFIADFLVPDSQKSRFGTLYKIDKKPTASLAERITFGIVFIPLFPIISAFRLLGNLLVLPYKIYQNKAARWSKEIFNHFFDFLLSPFDAFVLGFNRGRKGILSYLNYKPVPIFRYSQFIKGDELNLSYKNIFPSDVPYIIELLNHHPEIKNVYLAGYHLGDEGAMLFARLNKTATHLSLVNNAITSRGFEDFALENKIVTSLSIQDNSIDAIGGKNFAKANKFVTTLNLADNQLGAVGARDLALENKVVTILNISNNDIGDKGAEDFAAANTVIKKVDLSQNNIGANGGTNFAKNNTVISSVDLSYNQLGSEGGIGFAKNNKVTKTVNLTCTSLGSEGMVGFAEFNDVATNVNFSQNIIIGQDNIAAFASNNKAPTINLGNLMLNSKGAIIFAKYNTNATAVCLKRNNIDQRGFLGFATHNRVVRDVDFGGNDICLAGLQAFFERNKTATKIGLSWTPTINDDFAEIIAKFNTFAHELDLVGCNITNAGAKILLEDSVAHTKYLLDGNKVDQALLDEFHEANISRAVLLTSSVALAFERLQDNALKTSFYPHLQNILDYTATEVTLKTNNQLSAKLPKTDFFKANFASDVPEVKSTPSLRSNG